MTQDLPTKEKIIVEAIRLFAVYGFHGTSFQQIADQVGISQPGIFIHFKNKLLLFSAVREYVAVLNRTFVDSLVGIDDDAWTALQKHCQGNLNWVVENVQYWQISILLYYFACQDSQMKELNQRSLEAGEERILKYIYAGIREGLFRIENPQAKAREIHAFLIGQAIKYLSASRNPNPKEVKRDVTQFLQAVLSPSK